jgi:hypothetical protein
MRNKKDLAVVMTLLRDNGAHYVGCYYSGAGDSGEIESIALYGPSFDKRFQMDDIELTYGEQGDVEYDLPDDIHTYIEDIFYDQHLNSIEDWWNNDGGYGSIVMCTKTGYFKNYNHQYYQQTETYYHEGDITLE